MHSKSDIEILQSQTIEWLRFALAFLVVALHCSFSSDIVYSNGLSDFLRVIISVIGSLAVPAFFLVSGYFFFTGMQEWVWEKWKLKIRKRVKSLLVPYLLWCILAIVLDYVWEYLHQPLSFGEFWDSLKGFWAFYDTHRETSTNLFGYTISEGKPINVPLWYVRDLMFLCLLSPVIYKCVKKLGAAFLLMLSVLYILNIGLPFAGLRGVFFFGVGAYFMINGRLFIELFKRIKIYAYAASLCLLPFLVILHNGGNVIYGYLLRAFIITGVVSIFYLTYSLMKDRKIRVHSALSKSSFFIYASQAIVILDLSNFILWHLLPFEFETVLVLKVFLRPILATGICLGIFFFMRRFMPRTLSLLTGDRK